MAGGQNFLRPLVRVVPDLPPWDTEVGDSLSKRLHVHTLPYICTLLNVHILKEMFTFTYTLVYVFTFIDFKLIFCLKIR